MEAAMAAFKDSVRSINAELNAEKERAVEALLKKLTRAVPLRMLLDPGPYSLHRKCDRSMLTAVSEVTHSSWARVQMPAPSLQRNFPEAVEGQFMVYQCAMSKGTEKTNMMRSATARLPTSMLDMVRN